jgi:hypothetical protein
MTPQYSHCSSTTYLQNTQLVTYTTVHDACRSRSPPHTSNPIFLTTSYLGFPFGFFLPWLLYDFRCRLVSHNRSLFSFSMFAMHPQNHLTNIRRCKQRGTYEVCECLALLLAFRSVAQTSCHQSNQLLIHTPCCGTCHRIDIWLSMSARTSGDTSRGPCSRLVPRSTKYDFSSYSVRDISIGGNCRTGGVHHSYTSSSTSS